MSYPRGRLSARLRIWNPTTATSQYGGRSTRYVASPSPIWAWVTFTRGARALHNGQVDVYQALLIRCDMHPGTLTSLSRIEYRGKYYVIDSFQEDADKNETQMTCYQIDDINKQL